MADALSYQKETARIIIDQEADYLLCVKDNQLVLKKDVEDYVQDSALQKTMEIGFVTEKNYGRVETRTAYVTSDIGRFAQKDEWKNLRCIGAIHTKFSTKK